MKDNFLGFTEIIFLAYWLLTRTGFEIRESSIETGSNNMMSFLCIATTWIRVNMSTLLLPNGVSETD